MRVEGRSEGLLLDLAAFTQPPSPYQAMMRSSGTRSPSTSQPRHERARS